MKAREIISRPVFEVVDLDVFHAMDNSENDDLILDWEDRSQKQNSWDSHRSYNDLPKIVMTTDKSLLGKSVGKNKRKIVRLLSNDAIELVTRLLRELEFYKPAPDDNALISIMCNPVMMSMGSEYIQRRGTREDKAALAQGWDLFEAEILKEAVRGLEHRGAFQEQERIESVENVCQDSLTYITTSPCKFSCILMIIIY